MAMNNYRTFENLEAWKSAKRFRNSCRSICEKLPATEKYLLISQLTGSSRSTPSNIAEGFGRFHYQENIQFCRQGRGSLFESLDHLIEAFDSNYISETELMLLREEFTETLKLLNGYIAYLEKEKEKAKQAKSPTK